MPIHYPPPPWTIQGNGFFSIHLLDIERVQSYIPREFKVVSIFPGKTIGGLYVASYNASSSLIYNELIVVAGLVFHSNKIGAWISHIYVDNPNSVAGGREIWGLPKELAQFQWSLSGEPRVQVTQGDRLLCNLACEWQLPAMPLPSLVAPVMSTLDAIPVLFQASSLLKLRLIKATLETSPDSPFADLNLGQGWLSFYSDRLSVVVNAPTQLCQ